MGTRLHYAYLDGLRGLAALFVLLHHLRMLNNPWSRGAELPGWLERGGRVLDFGHYAVGVFIVLSGFCLMLPVAASGELRGGALEYLRRRARRILPPYYAALGLTLLLFALLPYLRADNGSFFDHALPVFTPDVILSHLLVVHDFSPGWILKINPPMWSVAIEWHIYFLMPWVLLPLRRHIGLPVTVLGLALLAVGLHFVTHGKSDQVSPQYVALFAAGMWAAQTKRTGWRWLGGGTVAICLAYFFLLPGFAWSRAYFSDLVIGLGAVAFILYCREHPPGWLQSRPMVWLGGISYSLYLVHFPLLRLLMDPLHHAGLPPVARFGAIMAVGTTLSLLVAWVFHRLFERPWLQVRPVPVFSPTEVPA